MWLLLLSTLTSPIWAALDTAAVIAIQNELNKHAAELEMLLDVRFSFPFLFTLTLVVFIMLTLRSRSHFCDIM